MVTGSADLRAMHALARFGFGRRGAEALPTDPVAWLHAQLQGPDPALNGPATDDDRPDTATVLRLIVAQQDMMKQAKQDGEKPTGAMHPAADIARREQHAFMDYAATTDTPFRERLVWFWANHFTVSLRQGGSGPLIGPYIREAIRPYVTGKFADMLMAVMRHPAMLLYLDNAGSVGPNSPAGQHGRRGLNENLARECLELHTVGADAGYSQADVTEFAKVLTGWSVESRGPNPGFVFRPRAHEPGEKHVWGLNVPEGEQGGMLVLYALGHTPATYKHIATKLVRHFIADDPPKAVVAKLTARLQASQGDLGDAARMLIATPAAWTPSTKFRTPQEYIVAALRAVDLPPQHGLDLVGSANLLGQPVWNAPLPNGWADRGPDWAGPEAVLRRVDWAYGLAGRVAATADPAALADTAMGPLLHAATLEQLRHAGSRRDAITLFLASPEFQRC